MKNIRNVLAGLHYRKKVLETLTFKRKFELHLGDSRESSA
jgi:hypothetical protein